MHPERMCQRASDKLICTLCLSQISSLIRTAMASLNVTPSNSAIALPTTLVEDLIKVQAEELTRLRKQLADAEVSFPVIIKALQVVLIDINAHR